MKRIIFLTVFLLISLASFAQTPTEHLTFKGVPIDGTLSEFVTKMKNAGFSHIGTEDGVALLNGDFAGYQDCTIGIKTIKKKDIVHEIAVLLPKQNTWQGLYFDYYKLKSMLSEKYGAPNNCREKFVNTPSYRNLKDDNDKMKEVEDNNCEYYSIFNITNGIITLAIENDGILYGCRIKLWYSDKINQKATIEAAMDDL